MEDNLISKKDLLELTGISYGQLYRWKRKNIIPEDWFIKKSSFTGQETYFPKEKILERVDKILNMKEDLSLDDLAEVFSPVPANISFGKEELLQKNIVSQMSVEIYEDYHGETQVFSFENILYIGLLQRILNSGEVSLEEGKLILKTMEENFSKFDGRPCEMMLLRKFGVAVCLLTSFPNEVYIEGSAKLVFKVNINKEIEELKLKL